MTAQRKSILTCYKTCPNFILFVDPVQVQEGSAQYRFCFIWLCVCLGERSTNQLHTKILGEEVQSFSKTQLDI